MNAPADDLVLRVVREVLAFPLAAVGLVGREADLWRPSADDGWSDLFYDLYNVTERKGPFYAAVHAGLALLKVGPIHPPTLREFVRLASAATRHQRVKDAMTEGLFVVTAGSPAMVAAVTKRASRARWVIPNTFGWPPGLAAMVLDGADDVYAHYWSLWVNPVISEAKAGESDMGCRIQTLRVVPEHPFSASVGGVS